IVALCRRFIDAFEGFITIVEDDFRQYEMLWGKSFFNALFLPVPRTILPEKPHSFSIWITRIFYPDDEFFGQDYSVMGELYVNFHVAGLVIGGWVFGIMLRTFESYYVENRRNASFVYLYIYLYMLPMGW